MAESIAASPPSASTSATCGPSPQRPRPLTVADHLAALERHGLHVDVVLYDHRLSAIIPFVLVQYPGWSEAPLVGRNGFVHDPALLCRTLSAALARSW